MNTRVLLAACLCALALSACDRRVEPSEVVKQSDAGTTEEPAPASTLPDPVPPQEQVPQLEGEDGRPLPQSPPTPPVQPPPVSPELPPPPQPSESPQPEALPVQR